MRKKQIRISEDQEYAKFLKDPEKEDELRQAVLKAGKVKPIHLDHRLELVQEVEWDNILNKPDIDAMLAAQDELSELEDVCIVGPAADDVLTWDAVNNCWKNALLASLNQDFDEGVLGEAITQFWQLLKNLVKIEDAFTGVPDIDEGVLP